MTHIVINDFAGHAFTLDLAESLEKHGLEISYAYCSSNLTPHADFSTSRIDVTRIGSGRRFEKYGIARRLVSELRYGIGSARHVWRLRPDVVVVNNMPLGALAVVWLAARARRASYVVWLQDVTSGLVAGVLGRRSVVARLTESAEGFLLRRPDRLIAISPALADHASAFGLVPDRIRVLPNWPALQHLPVVERENPWSKQHDLGERPLILYSGTLARKHSPEHLLALADRLPDVDVVVVSEGEGATWIESRLAKRARDNLRLLPFQDARDLADVLGSADLLVALLNPAASSYSVPSKVMSYLCAGRAILASMPSDNDAARIIVEARAGVIVEPDDLDGFVEAAATLLAAPARREEMGSNARRHADLVFEPDAVMARFLEAAGLAGAPRSVGRGVVISEP